jgi:hypothetical protein
MPSSVLTARFITSIEFYFNNEKLLLSEKEKNKFEKNLKRSLINVTIEMKTLDSFYGHIKNEWLSMCQIYKLVLEMREALVKCPDLNSKLETKCVNLKKFIVYYGPKLNYKIQFEWNKEQKVYDITLGTRKSSQSAHNPHMLFLNEIKSFFSRTQSILNLLQILTNTSMVNAVVYYIIKY